MSQPRLIRSFFDLDKDSVDEAESIAMMRRYGFGKTSGWDDLLKSRLILLLSEAQAGKTFECQAQQEAMWVAGEAAFYVELSSVAHQPWSELRDPEETKRLERWRRTDAEMATVFLDSVDELALTQGNFRTALRNVANDLQGHMDRVRVVLTSRPLPVDRKLFERTFETPLVAPKLDENDFAALALGKKRDEKPKDAPPEIRFVALMPLSSEDVATVAAAKGVSDTQAFIGALRKSSMMDFMRRPQDVIEAAAAWIELDGSFGTHAQQEAFDIRSRLRANPERNDRPLSDAHSIEGAARLALAVVLTQRLTIQHNVNRDAGDATPVVDPGIILDDWDDDDRKALLERPLFGFASYGRVRFHNRLAFEFLAAQRLSDLLERGLSRRAVRRLLVVKTAQGFDAIRPSLRDVAAWLSLRQRWVFDLAISLDPALLMNLGDPGSFEIEQRQKVLVEYVERFGKGGWRGLSVPEIQVHRIADAALGPIVNEHFESVENPEVQQMLLDLIAQAPLPNCAAIARDVVWNPDFGRYVRSDGLDALIALGDPELAAIADRLTKGPEPWDHRFARLAIYKLFPAHMSVGQLIAILGWVEETRSTGMELTRILPTLVEKLDYGQLRELHNALVPLVDEGLRFDTNLHAAENERPHLVHFLAQVCARLVADGEMIPADAASAAMAAELARSVRSGESVPNSLNEAIDTAAPVIRRDIFVADVALLRRLHPSKPRLELFMELVWRGVLRFQPRDEEWMRELARDLNAAADVRAAVVLVETYNFARSTEDERAHLEALKPLLVDDAELASFLDDQLKPRDQSRQQRRYEICDRRRKLRQERRDAKARANWIGFWRELKDDPEKAFAPDRAESTARNLHRVMKQSGATNLSSGWDRKVIEDHLGAGVADSLRLALKPIWRCETPLLRHERSPSDHGMRWERWTLALVAIAAEAEDPKWVEGLTAGEAEQAIRYATLNWSNFPTWLDDLAATHPERVDRLIGAELTWSLGTAASEQGYSMLLQDIDTAQLGLAKLFLPRIRTWLESTGGLPSAKDDVEGAARRMDQAISIILKFGDDDDHGFLKDMASSTLVRGTNDPFAHIWLPALFALDPEAAVDRLEALCSGVAVSRESVVVDWIAQLFGHANRGRGVRIKQPGLSGKQIIRLLRLAYLHVDRADDAVHEGSYSPDRRDDAESGRDTLLYALMELGGLEGWAAKQEIADDPMFIHLRDRLQTLAREKSASEADNLAMRPDEVRKLDTNREPGPRTPAEMFALMSDRIADVRDRLLNDDSPIELWTSARDERVMRKAIAEHLGTHAAGAYTVAQESVTADEKETDIRLRSTVNAVEGVIELKIGDKRNYSGASLRTTITEQLVDKYLAPQGRRSGILLITRSTRVRWQDPDSGASMDFEALIGMLANEAKRIEGGYPDEIFLDAAGLDLKPRLTTERKATAKKESTSKKATAKPRAKPATAGRSS